jgi:hypothetical protein
MGSRWNYRLGDSLFVSAITEEGGGCSFSLPEGTWIHLGTDEVFEGGRAYRSTFSLDTYPLFLRKGALLPLGGEVECQDRGFRVPVDMTGVLVVPDNGEAFLLYEEGGRGARIEYTMDEQEMQWEISACSRSFLLHIKDVPAAASVSVDPWGLLVRHQEEEAFRTAETGWYAHERSGDLMIKPGPASRGLRVAIQWM